MVLIIRLHHRMMGFELNDQQEVWDIFRWMDRDCDGLIGFEEFVAAIVNQERREENF
ncbi:hypothetical protein KP509_04G089300 [Ceratopteris richardii]|uniref:EF-hand domain-containing protein n=1 Tax=Ceratopteris richardii TaxID=49495 RepID=A0A8T2UV08_CERRI|nr:hypothetical protein KP509_04G089300 [Ceratopteris richardii]